MGLWAWLWRTILVIFIDVGRICLNIEKENFLNKSYIQMHIHHICKFVHAYYAIYAFIPTYLIYNI